jgi:hypothetical protein
VARLADGQDGVHVDVGIDEGRREEAAFGIDLGAAVGGNHAGRADRLDPIPVNENVGRVDNTAQRWMDSRVAHDQSARCHVLPQL